MCENSDDENLDDAARADVPFYALGNEISRVVCKELLSELARNHRRLEALLTQWLGHSDARQVYDLPGASQKICRSMTQRGVPF